MTNSRICEHPYSIADHNGVITCMNCEGNFSQDEDGTWAPWSPPSSKSKKPKKHFRPSRFDDEE